MRVLVTWGTKRGGTEGIARQIGEALREGGAEVELMPAEAVRRMEGFDAAVVGGALYMARWHPAARRFTRRCGEALRRVPVWMFSSGPLDDSADRGEIAPTPQVARLMARVGALGHRTFGGRLAPDATGFLAAKIAKKHAGDFRRPEAIRAYGLEIAHALPSARSAYRAPAPRRYWAWAPLAALDLFVALTALGGGIAMMARPDGAYLRMATTALHRSPFSSFFLPGLILFAVIGGGHLASGLLALRRRTSGAIASGLAGAALLVWLSMELAVVEGHHIAQALYLLIGVLIIALSKVTYVKTHAGPTAARA